MRQTTGNVFGLAIQERALRATISLLFGIAIVGGVSCQSNDEQQRVAGKRQVDSIMLGRGMPAVGPTYAILEGYPDDVIRALESRAQRVAAVARQNPDSGFVAGVQSVIERSRVWNTGVITVAFSGGSPTLRANIADAVTAWSHAGNVQFDFWTDNTRQHFREWHPGERSYQADIRIAFNRRGYWSQVGTDAIDSTVAGPGAASLSLQGFDVTLPNTWRGITLHEFGHALGFMHEHQNPNGSCEEDFRWDDDQGYVPTRGIDGEFIPDAHGLRPGIYTTLEGPPNDWSRQTIDFNLRRFAPTPDLRYTQFDPASIMKYYFDSWMFRSGTASKCYSAENDVLSQVDQRTAAETYGAPTSGQRESPERELSRAIASAPATASEQVRLRQVLARMQPSNGPVKAGVAALRP